MRYLVILLLWGAADLCAQEAAVPPNKPRPEWMLSVSLLELLSPFQRSVSVDVEAILHQKWGFSAGVGRAFDSEVHIRTNQDLFQGWKSRFMFKHYWVHSAEISTHFGLYGRFNHFQIDRYYKVSRQGIAFTEWFLKEKQVRDMGVGLHYGLQWKPFSRAGLVLHSFAGIGLRRIYVQGQPFPADVEWKGSFWESWGLSKPDGRHNSVEMIIAFSAGWRF